MTRFALTCGLIAMGACWLYAWSALLGRFSDPARAAPLLSPVSIVALQMLAAFTTQFLGRPALTSRGMRLALLGTGVGAILVALRWDQFPASGGLEWLGLIATALATAIGGVTGPVLAFALGLFVWWRGITLGRQTATNVEVESAFRWGIAMLVLFGVVQLLIARADAVMRLQDETTIYVVGFFFVSMITLALGRLESLTTRTRSIGINGQWLSVLVAVSGCIVVVALALGQVLSFDLLVLATRPFFDLLGRVLLVLLYLIVIPLAYVVELLLYVVLSALRPFANNQRPQPPEPADVDNLLQRLLSQTVPPDLLALLKAVGAALVLLAVLVVLNRAFRRWRPTGAEGEAAQEERDSVFVARRAREALRAWLRRLLDRLLRRRRDAVGAAVAGEALVGAARVESNAVSVRGLYRRLLGVGDAAGVRRGVATTPLEHRAPLDGALEPPGVVDALTAAYVEVRYAERSVDAGTVQRLDAELARLRARERADG